MILNNMKVIVRNVIVDLIRPQDAISFENTFNLRFGIKDRKEKTLQEVGDLMGISKQRVQQIEDKVISALTELFDKGVCERKHYSSNHSFSLNKKEKQEIDSIKEKLALLSKKGPILNSDLEALFSTKLCHRKYLPVLMLATGYVLLHPNATELKKDIHSNICWVSREEFKQLKSLPEKIRSALGRGKLLTPTTLAKSLGIKEEELGRYLKFVNNIYTLEIKGQLYYSSKSLELSLPEEMKLILKDREPLSFKEIQEIILNTKGKLMSITKISNTLKQDPTFKPIGRSGYWTLVENTATNIIVRKAMVKVLMEEQPLNAEEIYERVKKMRGNTFKKETIDTFLREFDMFVKIENYDYNLYTLDTTKVID